MEMLIWIVSLMLVACWAGWIVGFRQGRELGREEGAHDALMDRLHKQEEAIR